MSRAPRWIRRLLPVAGVLFALATIAALVPMRTVDSDDMAWTYQPGDMVWIVSDRVRKADVVLLEDPMEPGRLVLRRAVAEAGQKVKIEENGVRVNGKRIRQVEMGTTDDYRVQKEVIWSKPPARPNPHFVQLLLEPTNYDLGGRVEVPDGHWFLLADNRDQAMDSRWWGPIAESAIKGVVRAHYTPTPDAWRFDKTLQLVIPEE